ncbi:hypothetical protein SSS_05301 [Sarcoptes scabiei]|uniref:Uncharacterized protein n=1 Tax=Sarcoptes scabiei TaxID=52283 RepID=A0A834VGN3_SARSC|nr:hypothetical protein SSS_05301 [Sarcoptes scabiei]UXI21482.1 WW domain-binding protein [Sarcoptes scabiei]
MTAVPMITFSVAEIHEVFRRNMRSSKHDQSDHSHDEIDEEVDVDSGRGDGGGEHPPQDHHHHFFHNFFHKNSNNSDVDALDAAVVVVNGNGNGRLSKSRSISNNKQLPNDSQEKIDPQNGLFLEHPKKSFSLLDMYKHNLKFMNSVWGLYNRYAPQAFQKNEEHSEQIQCDNGTKSSSI